MPLINAREAQGTAWTRANITVKLPRKTASRRQQHSGRTRIPANVSCSNGRSAANRQTQEAGHIILGNLWFYPKQQRPSECIYDYKIIVKGP